MWVASNFDMPPIVAGMDLPVYHTGTRRMAMARVISVNARGYADVNVGGARVYVRVAS